MLIIVFVFGCAQFAFASDDLTLKQYIEKYPVQYYILTKSDHTNGTKNGFYSSACDFDGTPSRVCGYIVSDGTMNSEISFVLILHGRTIIIGLMVGAVGAVLLVKIQTEYISLALVLL